MDNKLEIARVVAVDRERFVVVHANKEIQAEMTGKLMFSVESPLDYPAVGDWVQVQLVNQDSHAMIHAVGDRKTILKRKTAGKKISHQLIAANIDTAFIVQSLDHNYNSRIPGVSIIMAWLCKVISCRRVVAWRPLLSLARTCRVKNLSSSTSWFNKVVLPTPEDPSKQ